MNDAELRVELERHHAASYGWALSCCARNAVEAEDVLQTAYLRILEGRAPYEGRSAFRTWLFAVIRRTAADDRRRRMLRQLGLARYERARPVDDRPTPPTLALERSETQAAFQAALARLPRRQKEVLHLVFYQDLTIEEAAEVMGVSLGSARQHYARGKDRLRKHLKGTEMSNG